jgi:hypothetical protein
LLNLGQFIFPEKHGDAVLFEPFERQNRRIEFTRARARC